jgi:hypothetical protein
MKSDEQKSTPLFTDLHGWLAAQDSIDEKTRQDLVRLVMSTDGTEGLSAAALIQIRDRLFATRSKAVQFRKLAFVSVGLIVFSLSGAFVVAREGYFSMFRTADRDGGQLSSSGTEQRKFAGSRNRRHSAVASTAEVNRQTSPSTNQLEGDANAEQIRNEPALDSEARPTRRRPSSVAAATLLPRWNRSTEPALERSNGLGVESDMLKTAMNMKREDRDLHSALAVLDAYDRAFPSGVLANEARLVRVETLILLERKPEALNVLDAMALKEGGRETELLLLRAELRASMDCSKAIVDFGIVLGRAARDEYHERALFGRGVCYHALGNEIDAGHDFENYLQRFPKGKFGDAIRKSR